MKISVPVEFEYVEPKIPEDVIDNTTLLISFVLQARSAFISAMDVWYDRNYPLKDVDVKEEFQQGVLDILRNPNFYEKEVTQAAIDFKAEETRSEFSK